VNNNCSNTDIITAMNAVDKYASALFAYLEQGRFYGGVRGAAAPNEKYDPPVAPHFGPASLDFHLNRPVISLIRLQNTPVNP